VSAKTALQAALWLLIVGAVVGLSKKGSGAIGFGVVVGYGSGVGDSGGGFVKLGPSPSLFGGGLLISNQLSIANQILKALYHKKRSMRAMVASKAERRGSRDVSHITLWANGKACELYDQESLIR
jgi:hypothetical protein